MDDAAMERCTKLMKLVFPPVPYTDAWIRWQYKDNPAGNVIGWNAIAADGTLAAHYALQPMRACVCGAENTGCLSLNTATHPAHQGKGLFTKLAQLTYESAAAEGMQFVVGIANANSTPGFTRKLGFALVTPLHARIGVGLRISEDGEAEFDRMWTSDELRWRASKPGASYRAIGDRLYAAASQPLVRALLVQRENVRGMAASQLGIRPFDLWIGLEPGGPAPGIEIVGPLRPSPLNFIFLDLTDRKRQLTAMGIRFRAADFDAY